MTRRDLLLSVGAAAGGTLCSFLESSCGQRFIEFGVRIKGKRRRIRIERKLRTGPLEVNETLILRRYSGHTPLHVREARLVRLARTAPVEEAFFCTLPDNTWTEIGVLTERGENAWKGYGVRRLPVRALRHLFSGRITGIPRPHRILNYHIHPIRFVRNAVRSAGLPHRYEKLAYLPSAGDFFTHARVKTAFAQRGIELKSKVAVPNAVIEYDTSQELTRRILFKRNPKQMKIMDVYETARLHYIDTGLTQEEFPNLLSGRLKWAGFKGDEFTMVVSKKRSSK